MRFRTLMVLLISAALTATAAAQTKISGTLQCAKADPAHSIEVGDAPGHMMTLGKVACTWSKTFEMGGSTSKDGYSIASSEIEGGKSTETGVHAGTMSNGDRYFVKFHGTGTVAKDGGASVAGTWSFTGGTGKLKGLTGGGTYKTTGAADGTGTAQVEGEARTP